MDVLAVAILAVSGWFVWPSASPPASRGIPREAPVAYGWMAPHAAGPLQNPGLFAFSSPIGFGSMSEALRMANPRWSLAGVRPYVSPLEPPSVPISEQPPPSPEAVPRVVPLVLPEPAVVPFRPARGPAPQGAPLPRVQVQQAASLRDRDFSAPALEGVLLEAPGASGELRAYLRLTPQGRVASVVFSQTSLPWSFLRTVESALSRGVAASSAEPAEGWLWMAWANPSPPSRDEPVAP